MRELRKAGLRAERSKCILFDLAGTTELTIFHREALDLSAEPDAVLGSMFEQQE